jgi:hypothetical protein
MNQSVRHPGRKKETVDDRVDDELRDEELSWKDDDDSESINPDTENWKEKTKPVEAEGESDETEASENATTTVGDDVDGALMKVAIDPYGGAEASGDSDTSFGEESSCDDDDDCEKLPPNFPEPVFLSPDELEASIKSDSYLLRQVKTAVKLGGEWELSVADCIVYAQAYINFKKHFGIPMPVEMYMHYMTHAMKNHSYHKMMFEWGPVNAARSIQAFCRGYLQRRKTQASVGDRVDEQSSCDDDDDCEKCDDPYGGAEASGGSDDECWEFDGGAEASGDDFQAAEKGSDGDEIIQRRDSVDSLDAFDFQYCHNDEVWEEPYVVRDVKGNIVYDDKTYYGLWREAEHASRSARGLLFDAHEEAAAQLVPDDIFDEWVQKISKIKANRREKKFKSHVHQGNGARLRVRYNKGLFWIYSPKHKDWSVAGPAIRFTRQALSVVKNRDSIIGNTGKMSLEGRAMVVAAVRGDDMSIEYYKATLQNRVQSNLTGKHTARHKYVKVGRSRKYRAS